MCALRQRIKIFPLVVVKSRMGAVHSTGESWHMAEGLWWRVCSSIWQAQGSRSTGSHSRLNILCFWLGDLLPQPKFGSQTKTVEENTTFDQTISPPALFLCFTSTFQMKSLKAKRKPGKWWSQPSYIQESAWGKPRFNPLFCLASLEFAFPTTKKKNPTAELLRDVSGYMETFLGICHAWFLWSQFLFVGSTQILIEQKRRTVRGTTWFNISSQKYGGNLLHFLLFALQ